LCSIAPDLKFIYDLIYIPITSIFNVPCLKFIEYAKKLETLKYLAENKRTGTPLQLARKLSVSERTVRRMVQRLRDQGYLIIFNRFRNSYEVEISERAIEKFQ